MRALGTFLVTVIFIGAVGYAGFIYLQQHRDSFKEGSLTGKLAKAVSPTPPGQIKIPPHGPVDYAILEDQGGQPLAEAIAAGLTTDKWAYLSAMSPVQASEGITKTQGAKVRGKNYDLGFKFASTAPQEQVLEFNLGAKWDELHFGFGFSDTEPSDPTKTHSIELTVQGDGKPIFGPQAISPTDKPIFRQLDIKGVNRLVFVSKRIGSSNMFAPVLIDPFVKLAETPPAPPLGPAGAK